ncbi:hypothetical protein QYF36_004526 [Acer negundo]|nr:hypothetical protein QYF36_004526 [Acer negundo]
MSVILCLICILFLVGCELGEAKQGKYLIAGNKAVACQIVVDQSGHGTFSSIQSAINSIPSDNQNWVCIFITAGIYREKVKIPYDKPYIILKGEGKRSTQIIWDDHDSIAQSPTFASMADNVVVSHITFVNSYNGPYGNSKNPRVPAVAAMIGGDKTSFHRCRFSGVQDTLWDDQGIEEGLSGFITAQGRTNPDDANGFVFKRCIVIGTGTTYLGRPWRNYARVFFYKSNLTNVIQPQGWNSWNAAGREHQITFAEHGCYGPGSDTSNRVTWEKKLSTNQVKKLTSIAFIDTEGWLQKQPK